MQRIVVVGASLAGLRAAEMLRREGYGGELHIVGEEPHLPYDRPPLSKQVLTGAWERDRTFLLDSDTERLLGATWHLDTRAIGLDLDARQVRLERDSTLEYDGLIIATGARPRRLPGTEGLGGVHALRTIDDATALRADIDAGARAAVVVGAGFIGAEVTASLRTLGLDVAMVEALPAPFERVLGVEMGSVIIDAHREQGVDVRVGVGVQELIGSERVEQVVLADGTVLAADLVVVGVGVIPNTEWLEGSGLTLDNGVVCDETCLAAPGVVAAGDVARWLNRRFDEVMRVEHWDNAVDQGGHAARRLLAGDDADLDEFAYEPIPWFWTDQYAMKIQLAGRSGPGQRIEVVSGSVAERKFAAIYGRDDRLVAVLGFNRPRQVMQYRQLIADGASFDDALTFAAGSA